MRGEKRGGERRRAGKVEPDGTTKVDCFCVFADRDAKLNFCIEYFIFIYFFSLKPCVFEMPMHYS